MMRGGSSRPGNAREAASATPPGDGSASFPEAAAPERRSRPFASENEILEALNRVFPNAHPSVPIGRGDDCAELRSSGRLCVSTDLFLEHVHFRRGYFSPAQIGRKALAVNLSDIAACGARPAGFSMGLILPPDLSARETEELFVGMAELAERHETPLTGGDLSHGQSLGLCVTIFGEPAFAGAPFLRRARARPGHVLFLVGREGSGPGLARAGLLALETDPKSAERLYPMARAAHLDPEPLVPEGLALAEFAAGHPKAEIGLMDLSDGLARDLPRLLGPGLAARVTLDPRKLPAEVKAYAETHGQDPACFAYLGGEDYLLLGSCAPNALDALRDAVPGILPIGEAYAGDRMFLNGKRTLQRGFDHFSS